MAFRGKDVLIVDLDPQANLTFSFFTVEKWQKLDGKSKTIKHWYDAFLEEDKDMPLSDLIVSPKKVNKKLEELGSTGSIDIISSHLELINVDMELATRYGGNTDRTIRSSFLRLFSRLQKGLEEIEDEYDVVIIDCPPNFNIVTQNAIIASDLYLVPARPDVLSTIGIDQLARHIETLTERYNGFVDSAGGAWKHATPSMLGVVFTMVNIYKQEPISTQREFITRVKRSGYPVFDSFMRDNKTLFAKSPDYGVPVVLDDDLSGIYLDIRKELEEIVDEVETEAKL